MLACGTSTLYRFAQRAATSAFSRELSGGQFQVSVGELGERKSRNGDFFPNVPLLGLLEHLLPELLAPRLLLCPPLALGIVFGQPHSRYLRK